MNKKLSLIRLGVLIMGFFVVGLSYGKPTEQPVQVETLQKIKVLLSNLMEKSGKLVFAHKSNASNVKDIKKEIKDIENKLMKKHKDVYDQLKDLIKNVSQDPTQENLQSLAAAVDEIDASIVKAITEDIAAKKILLSGGNQDVIEAQVANVNQANEKAQEASWYNTIVNGASSAWKGVKDYFLDDQKSIARKGLEIAVGTAVVGAVALGAKYSMSQWGSGSVTTEMSSGQDNTSTTTDVISVDQNPGNISPVMRPTAPGGQDTGKTPLAGQGTGGTPLGEGNTPRVVDVIPVNQTPTAGQDVRSLMNSSINRLESNLYEGQLNVPTQDYSEAAGYLSGLQETVREYADSAGQGMPLLIKSVESLKSDLAEGQLNVPRENYPESYWRSLQETARGYARTALEAGNQAAEKVGQFFDSRVDRSQPDRIEQWNKAAEERAADYNKKWYSKTPEQREQEEKNANENAQASLSRLQNAVNQGQQGLTSAIDKVKNTVDRATPLLVKGNSVPQPEFSSAQQPSVEQTVLPPVMIEEQPGVQEAKVAELQSLLESLKEQKQIAQQTIQDNVELIRREQDKKNTLTGRKKSSAKEVNLYKLEAKKDYITPIDQQIREVKEQIKALR